MILAAVGYVGWRLAMFMGAGSSSGSPHDNPPAQNYGARVQSVQRSRQTGRYNSSSEAYGYDTTNVMSPDEIDAYEQAAERRQMRQRGYRPDGAGGYTKLDSPGGGRIIEGKPAPSMGISAARQAQQVLHERPEAKVHFSAMSQAERQEMEAALGPHFICRIDYQAYQVGGVTVLRHPTAGQPIYGMPDGKGGFIPDPEGVPTNLADGRFEARWVTNDDGTISVYFDRKF